MRHTSLREYAALIALSGSGGLSLLIPLYVAAEGYPTSMIGLLAGLGGVAALLSRFPVPRVYRPGRAVPLLVGLAAIGCVTSIAMPLVPNLWAFAALIFVNRATAGAATAIYLARFLDMTADNPDRRKTMGFYGGTQAVGFTMANFSIGVLADWLGFSAAFFYGAVLSAVAGLVLLGSSTPTSRRPVPPPAPRPRGPRGWLTAVSDPGLWGVLNVNMWNNLFHVVNTSFFPVLGLAAGLPANQIGIARALYSLVNAIGRPAAGLVMGRLTLRQVSYLGMTVQAVLLCLLPLIHDLVLFILFALITGIGRAVVVVASSAALAEDVDETRVSRGVSTAVYSTTQDLPSSLGPPIAGVVATFVGVAGMFPLMTLGVVACYLAGDLSVARWRGRRFAQRAERATSTA